MKNYNDTTYAILGILTTNCRSGYSIKQFIDQSLNHFWKISYGQIYPTLKLIVQEGLAEVHTSSSTGKPDKHEYYLTEKGVETLKNWLEQPIEQLPVERNEVLLKLFFGRFQSREKTISLLENYKQKLESRYQTYVSIEQAIINYPDNDTDPDSMYWLLTLDYGKRTTKASIEWCEFTLEKFLTKEDS
ncbi:PadR family transcriptional regulator [Lysinibacillus telephonicus]|uniref:PadR family transcriptional regulator n=1 Tax=Lysinibacillus telephonicus TaxID=1714840 RepID=UPI00397A5A9F